MKNFVKMLVFFMIVVPKTYANEDIAVVDLSKVVNTSAQVKSLKKEHAKKAEELNKIIVNARGEILNEKDQGRVLVLEEKYTKEFNDKKNALEKEYMTKLSVIDKNVRDKIAQQAKESGYKYVFAKSVLLYGGDDITEDIIKEISK